MSKPWNMASVRQRQPVRKYKVCGPVGDDGMNRVSSMPPGIYRVLRHGALQDVVVTARGQAIERCEPETCPKCRHHVCSCPPKRVYMGMDLGVAESESRTIVYETVAGKLTVVVDPKHVGPPRFVAPLEKRHEAERERRGS